ncbi:lipopolysaccharide transport periplasmic protein LptA [Echinimonas agarilytica]|uniref:Lipopolysaccharide export system protein LptA n=1 Tax=Echinimonas agarilytica TaxID=1215918 RepID=A0AA41W5A1_9GAMM|nr:lipopolysaccharide transport periplasmic protein LptA [Echinimonas agarilytica]MCM2678613.1 lipopolysaccharide transport periplasmic protein LptA [Echinimonas agarilytica]
MNKLQRISAAALIAICPFSYAVKSDFSERVVIESERQTIDMKSNVVTYIGDVKVTQGTLQIFADTLTILNATEEGQQVLVANGKPANYSQILDNGKAMDAQALRVRYELGERILLLTGEAQLTQEDSLVKGDKILYNLEQQLLEADSKDDGSARVTTIFIPDQVQEQLDDQKK